MRTLPPPRQLAANDPGSGLLAGVHGILMYSLWLELNPEVEDDLVVVTSDHMPKHPLMEEPDTGVRAIQDEVGKTEENDNVHVSRIDTKGNARLIYVEELATILNEKKEQSWNKVNWKLSSGQHWTM
ncbi:hypothetical protein L1987_80375 [Smallanthus sonchifolius]|uniref:Uncharacterized protein n=1 Tax=Smallanthus sonchifolius TaxID=185202 RepID=A0ACB8YLU6_9ASTR|nr:hypothetical protein L1987_80375 [Smallanthus sonchifolius]